MKLVTVIYYVNDEDVEGFQEELKNNFYGSNFGISWSKPMISPVPEELIDMAEDC